MDNLYIYEIFGPTIQGEGNNVGKLCYFIRLSGCDQNPACKWCDTLHAYNIKSGKQMTIEEIVNELERINKEKKLKRIPRVIITGGNPCVQDNYYLLSKAIKDKFKNCETCIETQGTILNIDKLNSFDHITISPKGPSSFPVKGMFQNYIPIIDFFKENRNYKFEAEIKVVVFNFEDLDWAVKLIADFNSAMLPRMLYTVQLGTPMNDIDRVLDADEIINFISHLKTSIGSQQLQRIRILPQVHQLLKVK